MNERTELEQMRGRLERFERLLACYLKALGHELPNQLVAIQGLARVLELEARERLNDDSRQYLDRLSGLAQRAHQLARALAAAGQAIREDQPAEVIALDEALREAVAEINFLYPGLPIEYDFAEVVPTLTVARPTLRLVLVQLLRNAARATPEDRPVPIRVGAHRTGAVVEFWVADDGRGMSLEQQHNLFEPFAAGRTDPGNELGLFLVRLVVESWGGVLRVQSESERGNTITITMFSGERETAEWPPPAPAKRESHD